MIFNQNENFLTEKNSLNKIFSKIKNLSIKKNLPSKKTLLDLLFCVNEILQNEVCNYRAPIDGTENIPGSLLDFCNFDELNENTKIEKQISTDIIVIPDLHARKNLIFKILNYVPRKKSTEKNKDIFNNSAFNNSTKKNIFTLLSENKITLIFLGDIMHSESLQKVRWQNAFEKYELGQVDSLEMTEEMIDSLSTLMQVLLLKKSFPQNVHILKGNHENIKNETGNGNFSFKKFAQEGQMVFDFIQQKFGRKVIETISTFENLLPLAAIFPQIMISHAEPKKYFSKTEIINAELNPTVIEDLTWTKNDDAELGCVEKMLAENCSKKFINSNSILNLQNAKYITGHRPVKEKFATRQNGFLIQIHNPKKMQFAYIQKNCAFNPEHDIIELR